MVHAYSGIGHVGQPRLMLGQAGDRGERMGGDVSAVERKMHVQLARGMMTLPLVMLLAVPIVEDTEYDRPVDDEVAVSLHPGPIKSRQPYTHAMQ